MNPGSDDTSDLEKVQELLRVGIEDQQTVISRPNQVRGPAADLKNELGSGRYEPGPEIGRGGMGKVVATLEKPLHRSVALKVLLSSSNDEYQRRFIREARITGRLEHPSIVPIHELNVDERGRIFYTMKLVKGITLQDLLVRLRERDVEALQRYRLPALLTIFQKVCDAVAFAHAQSPRIIHRDLKPANIMIGDYGEVLVMDWGAAKLLSDRNARGQTLDAALDTPPSSTASGEHQVDNNAPGLLNDDEPLVTQAGMVIGTPGYMAPEQVSGRTDGVDECTDIYALGAILYSLLTLEAPGQVTTRELEQLDAESRAKVSTLFRDRVAPLLANSENRKSLSHLLRKAIPDSLVAVALKAMSFRPEDRFQSVKQLQADVGAYQAGRATTAEQAGAWKQLKLLVARNKVLFSAIAAIFIVLLAATAISMHERQATLRSNEALQLTLHHASDADLEAARQRFQAGAWREGVALLGRSLSFWPENKQATSYLLTAIEFGYGDRDKLPIFGVYHSDELEEAAFSADGEYFITTSDDHTARTWKAQNGAPVARLSRHSAPVWCGRFSPNSRKVVTTDEVGVGYVWDPRTGNALIRPLQHGKPQLDTVSIVETAVFSADGHRILTGCWDHTARLWNADTGEELAELLNPNRVADAVFSPDETRILVSYWNGGAVLWDASTFQPIGSPMAHSATVRRSVFTPDGNKIVTSSLDKTARIWDGHTARPLSAPIVHGDKVFDLDIRSDGKVFVTACYDNNARLWSLDYGTPIGSPMHHDGPINTAVFSPDGKRVLTASRDKTARLWDAASCKQLGNPMRHDEMVVKAIFSPDGTKVLSIGADAAAYLWNGQPPAPPGEAIPIPGSAYFAQ
ncbi:MAG: serine/threonine protein kinase, partial [Verrucomicrobia bacterium]|nr:serine/threonine protein kinase [Verrucomicrobiota bacterium]